MARLRRTPHGQRPAGGRRDAKFTGLLHQIYAIERLRAAYHAIRRDAAAGVDGQTWHGYGKELEANLLDLPDRLARGGYRSEPVRRAYKTKADGSKRPPTVGRLRLRGVPAQEDKIVQRASAKRLQAKLHAVKDELRKRMHRPIAEQGQYLRAVVAGHSRYFAAPCNGAQVQVLRFQVARLWHRTLCRHSQGKHLGWKRMHRIVDHWLPRPRICHPYPNQRLIVTTLGKSRVR